MEARVSGRIRGLVFLAVLFLIKPTAGDFTGSPLGTESYASTGTEDSDQSIEFSTDFSTAPRAEISERASSFSLTSTSRSSAAFYPSSSQRESHTGSPLGTESASTGTEDSDQSTEFSTDFSTAPREVISERASSFSFSSTSRSSAAFHPSSSHQESHTATEQRSFTEVMKSLTTENESDMSSDLPGSSPAFSTNTGTEFEDPSTVTNIANADTIAEEEQPTSKFRTTVTKLTAQEHTDQDTTESGSNSDGTYISTTISRAGERTLLSIISNSTSTYMEDTSSSISGTAPHTVIGQVKKTGVTPHMEYTEDGVSTQSGHSEATSDDLSTNATQREGFETEVSEFHTGQPTVTGSDFEPMPKTSNPSSTPPLTVINSSDSEVDITANSSTTRDFFSDSSSSSSFIRPFNRPDITHTSLSHQSTETTETPTGPVITSTDEKPDEPKTFMEQTTIPGLTVLPSTLWDITTSEDESQSTQKTFISQTSSLPEPTTVLSTHAEPTTHIPLLTIEDKQKGSTVPVTSTTVDSMGTTAAFTTNQFQASTTAKAQSTLQSTLAATETTKKTTTTTEKHHLTTGIATLSASSSQSGAGATDVSTLHFETSTATPGSTTSHSRHTTASYNKTSPTTSTVVITTGKHTDTKATTTQMPEKLSQTPDVDECASNPCPQRSKCVNTNGSFRCNCDFGYDLQDGRSCTLTKMFLVIFKMNGSLHGSRKGIEQLLNVSLSNMHGYRRSILLDLESLEILTVNMFSMSTNVTSKDVHQMIQMSLANCKQSHCTLKFQHQLNYRVLSLCLPQENRCDSQYGVWNDTDGTPYCQCHEGYFKNSTQRDCREGFKHVNGTCIECPFGFGGFNCSNFYELIAKVVFPAAGGLLLIIIIALIIACCRKDKNDINKIIFKSGDLPMSPCGEFSKSNRVSMEWGRETIEMQENGSTKNLLQMTDIYYSPALRNADLERNGFYPFLGLPGSRHSCIYPAQWNPSFINDDSRRRDYF